MYDKFNIKLISNNKTLAIKSNTSYNLINIDGIEKAEFELNTVFNSHYDGSVVLSKRLKNRFISITADYKGINK